MKSVLISTRPKWCEKICHEIGKEEAGKPIYEKRIEVRKGRPSEVPFRGLIYATKPKKWYKSGPLLISDESLWVANGKVKMCDGLEFWADSVENYHCLNGKVIGEFICDKVDMEIVGYINHEPCYWNLLDGSCLTKDELMNYGKWNTLYGWHISDLKIYDKPKELSEFKGLCKVKTDCHNCPHYNYSKMCCKSRTITRPPQSWMFVEEIEEK